MTKFEFPFFPPLISEYHGIIIQSFGHMFIMPLLLREVIKYTYSVCSYNTMYIRVTFSVLLLIIAQPIIIIPNFPTQSTIEVTCYNPGFNKVVDIRVRLLA